MQFENCIKWEREKGKRNWADKYFYCIIISIKDENICTCMCIYNFLTLYTNRNTIYTFRFCLYKWERRGWRARFGRVASEIWKRGEREQKYMYLYNFLCFIQLETIFIHLCLYKKWGSEREIGGEWRARYLGERSLTIFCKRLLWSTIKSNPRYSIYFRLLVCYYIQFSL